MERNLKGLLGYEIGALDGDIGKVKEFYFDDQSWTIRYLIVKTGSWLFGREVLVSPEAVMKNSWESATIPANLTKEQIRTSPDIDTNKPVSRQQEIELYGHYPWRPYWGSGFYGGGMWAAADTSPVIDEKIINTADDKGRIADEDLHLRSTMAVTGYDIHATDREIGHVKDFIIDDKTWKIVYLVVDASPWFSEKKVLIEVGHVREIQWEKSIVQVDITAETVKNSEAYKEPEFRNPEFYSASAVKL